MEFQSRKSRGNLLNMELPYYLDKNLSRLKSTATVDTIELLIPFLCEDRRITPLTGQGSLSFNYSTFENKKSMYVLNTL